MSDERIDLIDVDKRIMNNYGATNTSGYKQSFKKAFADVLGMRDHIATLEARNQQLENGATMSIEEIKRRLAAKSDATSREAGLYIAALETRNQQLEDVMAAAARVIDAHWDNLGHSVYCEARSDLLDDLDDKLKAAGENAKNAAQSED